MKYWYVSFDAAELIIFFYQYCRGLLVLLDSTPLWAFSNLISHHDRPTDEPCTVNARRPTVDSRCHGTTIICCVADLRRCLPTTSMTGVQQLTRYCGVLSCQHLCMMTPSLYVTRAATSHGDNPVLSRSSLCFVLFASQCAACFGSLSSSIHETSNRLHQN